MFSGFLCLFRAIHTPGVPGGEAGEGLAGPDKGAEGFDEQRGPREPGLRVEAHRQRQVQGRELVGGPGPWEHMLSPSVPRCAYLGGSVGTRPIRNVDEEGREMGPKSRGLIQSLGQHGPQGALMWTKFGAAGG